MSTALPSKSATVRNAVKVALGAAVATPLLFAAGPASAADVQVGDTTVDVGGFVRMDAYYDFEHAAGISLTPSDATNTNDDDPTFGASAQYTRLTFSINTPTSVGDVGGYIEADFAGGATGNKVGLRVRQAYVTYGNWLIGKAWTTFANFHYGPTVDFGGPTGQVFGRQKQVRYTIDLGNGSNFAIALEADQSGTGSEAGANVPGTGGVLPALVMRYQGAAGVFSYQAAAMVRQLEGQDTPGDESSEDSAVSWAVNLGGTVALATGTTVKLSAAYGEGVGGYILAFTKKTQDAYFDGSGDLQLNSKLGITASLVQQFTDTLSGSLVYGYGEMDHGSTDTSYQAQSITVGMFYSPVDPLSFGLGYKYVTQDHDGFDGNKDANRVTFSTVYSF